MGEGLLSEGDGLRRLDYDEGFREMGFDLREVATKDLSQAINLRVIAVMFGHKLQDIMEELADLLIFSFSFLLSIQRKQLAPEHDFQDISFL